MSKLKYISFVFILLIGLGSCTKIEPFSSVDDASFQKKGVCTNEDEETRPVGANDTDVVDPDEDEDLDIETVVDPDEDEDMDIEGVVDPDEDEDMDIENDSSKDDLDYNLPDIVDPNKEDANGTVSGGSSGSLDGGK